MAENYAARLPQDQEGVSMQEYPSARPALKVAAYAPPAASSVISFNAGTTVVEVAALNASLAIKWGSASVISSGATANFDHIVPVGQVRRFVVPVSTMGVPSIVGANVKNGLYNSMAVIATASVLTAINEF